MCSIILEKNSHESNNFTRWYFYAKRKKVSGTHRLVCVCVYIARLKNAPFVAKLDENSPLSLSLSLSFIHSIFQSNHACIVTQNYSQIRFPPSKSISYKSNGFHFIMDSRRYGVLGSFIRVLRVLKPLLDSVWQQNWWDEALRDRNMLNA